MHYSLWEYVVVENGTFHLGFLQDKIEIGLSAEMPRSPKQKTLDLFLPALSYPQLLSSRTRAFQILSSA